MRVLLLFECYADFAALGDGRGQAYGLRFELVATIAANPDPEPVGRVLRGPAVIVVPECCYIVICWQDVSQEMAQERRVEHFGDDGDDLFIVVDLDLELAVRQTGKTVF